jgi:hypothetical protein
VGCQTKKNDASLPEMQLIKTQDMFEMDPSIIPPSNEVGLSDGVKDVAKEVLGNSKKLLIQAKRKSNVFPNKLPKRVTKIGGPFEDVSQIWIDHGGAKGIKQKHGSHAIIF